MKLIEINDNRIVQIDYIFLLRQLVEAEEKGNTMLQSEIKKLLFEFLEDAERHRRLSYGPSIKIGDLKKIFSLNACKNQII